MPGSGGADKDNDEAGIMLSLGSLVIFSIDLKK